LSHGRDLSQLVDDLAHATRAKGYIYAGDDPVNFVDPLGLCKSFWNCVRAAQNKVAKVTHPVERALKDTSDVIRFFWRVPVLGPCAVGATAGFVAGGIGDAIGGATAGGIGALPGAALGATGGAVFGCVVGMIGSKR
jgi:hypothetical protein